MAKKYDELDGVWRTVGGRRIFIKTGQKLSDAMKESGKYKTKEKEHKNVYNRSNPEIDDAIQTFNDFKKYEKFDANEWNSANQEKRDELAKESLRNYLKDARLTKEEVEDLSDVMENENHHTEARLIGKVYNEMNSSEKSTRDSMSKKDRETLDKYMKIPQEERVKAAEEGKDWRDLVREHENVKTLDGSYETDNKGRKVTQKEYDEFRKAYMEGKISKEDYRSDNYDALKQVKENDNKQLKEKIGNDVTKLQEEAHKRGMLPSELQDQLGIKDSDLGLKDEYTERFEKQMAGMQRELKAEEAKRASYSINARLKNDAETTNKQEYLTKGQMMDVVDKWSSEGFQEGKYKSEYGKGVFHEKYASGQLEGYGGKNDDFVIKGFDLGSAPEKEALNDLNAHLSKYGYEAKYMKSGTVHQDIRIKKIENKSSNKSVYRNAFNEYLREHPNSKMKFEDFMKNLK